MFKILNTLSFNKQTVLLLQSFRNVVAGETKHLLHDHINSAVFPDGFGDGDQPTAESFTKTTGYQPQRSSHSPRCEFFFVIN